MCIRDRAKDYLWDVLPAVHLSYPELFENNRIKLSSTVEDFGSGMIRKGDEEDLPQINMPSKILDVDRFNRIVDEAWAGCPVSK